MKTHKGSELPTLREKQCSLIYVDGWTGKVLDAKAEKPCDVTREDWVVIFDSFEEAELHASKMIAQHPGLQCSIYDYQKQWVKNIPES